MSGLALWGRGRVCWMFVVAGGARAASAVCVGYYFLSNFSRGRPTCAHIRASRGPYVRADRPGGPNSRKDWTKNQKSQARRRGALGLLGTGKTPPALRTRTTRARAAHVLSQNNHKIITKSSQNHHKTISKSSQNHHKIITKSAQNHHKIITKSSQIHHKFIAKSSRNHHKIITKSSRNHHKIVTK